MVGAGLLAKKALEKGLNVKPYVKTSLAPGSRVVTEYLKKAGLIDPLAQLGFNVVGYGCTTCIGNSGPLPGEVAKAVNEGDLVAAAVLSGNRNFEGRVHPLVKANFLASPPLVVAYALAGTVDIDLDNEPLGEGTDGPVYLRDIWPTQQEISETIISSVHMKMFEERYASVFEGSDSWKEIEVSGGDIYEWDEKSTYIHHPPYFQDLTLDVSSVEDIKAARVLGLFRDSITTDHISPAGNIAADSPAGRYLQEQDVAPQYFNSYGSRRGNDLVMARGTFANIRLKNLLVEPKEGNLTKPFPDGAELSMYDAAMQYKEAGIPSIIHRLAVRAPGFLGEPLHEAGAVVDLAGGLGQGLALFVRHQARQVVAGREDRGVPGLEQGGPFAGRRIAPRGEGVARRADGRLHAGRPAPGHVAHDGRVGGVVDRQPLAAALPLPANVGRLAKQACVPEHHPTTVTPHATLADAALSWAWCPSPPFTLPFAAGLPSASGPRAHRSATGGRSSARADTS
jgi:hypothetical protein